MDFYIRRKPHCEAIQDAGRWNVQTGGKGAHEHREGNTQEMSGCDDRRSTRKAQGKAQQGEQ
eukprot:198436-Heterocapsa_arctica.AAC.1